MQSHATEEASLAPPQGLVRLAGRLAVPGDADDLVQSAMVRCMTRLIPEITSLAEQCRERVDDSAADVSMTAPQRRRVDDADGRSYTTDRHVVLGPSSDRTAVAVFDCARRSPRALTQSRR